MLRKLKDMFRHSLFLQIVFSTEARKMKDMFLNYHMLLRAAQFVNF